MFTEAERLRKEIEKRDDLIRSLYNTLNLLDSIHYLYDLLDDDEYNLLDMIRSSSKASELQNK